MSVQQPVLMGPLVRARLVRRVRLLVRGVIAYNAIEGIIAISAGVAASSASLVGFGLDSAIEVFSALAVAWQFGKQGSNHEQRERRTIRLIACSFYALAAYVATQSAWTLISQDAPSESRIGIVLTAVSVVIMPTLSRAQRNAGRALGSQSVVADSRQTMLCAALSVAVLVGLAANYMFGWWWADPVAGLVVAAIAVREGRDAWRGDACCAPTPLSETVNACGDDCCDG